MQRHEQNLHIALAAFLERSLQKPWMYWHTPNGGGRSKAEAGMFKAMGVRAGIPDLFVCGPNNWAARFEPVVPFTQPHLIAIELKAPPKALKRGVSKAKPRVSVAQSDTIAALHACGIPTIIVRSVEEAETQLRALGVPLKGRCV